jgi:EpsI family protein
MGDFHGGGGDPDPFPSDFGPVLQFRSAEGRMKSLSGNRILGIATAVLVVQALLFYSASHGEITPLAAPLDAFPTVVGSWHMTKEGVVPKEELDVLRADDTLVRFYGGPDGGADLFIAYFKTQRTGASPHSPKNCLPGAGWQPEQSGTIDVPVDNGSPIHINHYVVSRGENKSLVLYWYQSQGRVIADEFAAKFYLVADSIRKHRSDTSLVRVVVPVINGDLARADKTGTAFVKAFYPAVRNYLPR